jgi:hypothetical protein
MSHMLDQRGVATISGYALGNAAAGGIGQGRQVSLATALPPADGVSRDIFSIDGGRVLITGLLGEVTVAIPAASIDFDLAFDPDNAGTNVALATALVCDSDAAGTYYTLNDTFGGALVTSTANVLLNAILEEPFALGEGDIVWTTTGAGLIGTTARVKWDLWYVPLDVGAVVT